MLTSFSRAALALTLAAACAGITAGNAQTLKKMTLVQMHPIMGVGEEVFLYAVPKHLGYFAAEGLDVDIQNTQTGMISAQLLQSGNAQVGTTAGDAILSVREQGGDLVSFFNLKRNPGTFLVVLPDSPIHGLERSERQDHRRAVVWSRRRLGLEAEPDRARHHARSVHRDRDRRRTFGGRGVAQRQDRRAGDVGRDACGGREYRAGAAHRSTFRCRTGWSAPRWRRRRHSPTHTPKEVAGYCRAMTKGLVFTMTNRAAAVRILWDEFPNIKSDEPRRCHRAEERRARHGSLPRNGASGPARECASRRIHSRELGEHAHRLLRRSARSRAPNPRPPPTRQNSSPPATTSTTPPSWRRRKSGNHSAQAGIVGAVWRGCCRADPVAAPPSAPSVGSDQQKKNKRKARKRRSTDRRPRYRNFIRRARVARRGIGGSLCWRARGAPLPSRARENAVSMVNAACLLG